VFPGIGTVVNIAAVLLGTALGVLLGHRLTERTRDLVTDALGLTTLLIAALTVLDLRSPALADAVGTQAPVLIVLGSLVIGGICGSLLRVEDRLEALGGWLRDRLTPHGAAGEGRRRFVEGFVTASLLFCVGPLTILGSLSDGLGRGADQLYVKAALDGFAAIAFAASFGWGVAASVLVVAVVQGGFTLLGVPTSPHSGRPADWSWSPWPSGCCGCAASRSATCCRRWSWRPCSRRWSSRCGERRDRSGQTSPPR
jgi:uncharacterized protein